MLDDPGFESRKGQRIYFYLKRSRPTLGHTQPPIQCVSGTLSPGLKQPGREADHTPPSTAEVKNERGYASAPPAVLHDVYRNNCTSFHTAAAEFD
jgi:hypothetical protein